MKLSPVSFGKRHPGLRRAQDFSASTGGQYLSSPATVTLGSFSEEEVEGQSSLQFWAELGWIVQSQTQGAACGMMNILSQVCQVPTEEGTAGPRGTGRLFPGLGWE